MLIGVPFRGGWIRWRTDRLIRRGATSRTLHHLRRVHIHPAPIICEKRLFQHVPGDGRESAMRYWELDCEGFGRLWKSCLEILLTKT